MQVNGPDANEQDRRRLKAALIRYKAAVRALGEIGPNRVTYFEESVVKSAEAQRRWKELNDAGRQAAEALGEST